MTAGGRWYLTLTMVPFSPLCLWDPVRWSTQRQLLQISTGTYVRKTELAWHCDIFVYIYCTVTASLCMMEFTNRSYEKTVWKNYELSAVHIAT